MPAHTKVQKLIEDVTEKIASGEWPAGHQLPPDRELRLQYDVSQMTIRTAVERLHALRLIVSFAGKGRFVAERPDPGR